MARIACKLEQNYELFRNLQGLKVVEMYKKGSKQMLKAEELIKQNLKDGEEVLCEIESTDLWLRLIFRYYDMSKISINGHADLRIEHNESILELKKKIQKFSIKLWSRMHKCCENIFIMDKIDYKIRK